LFYVRWQYIGNFTSSNYNLNTTTKIVSHDLNICVNIRFPDNWHEGNNVFVENVSHMWLGKSPKLLWRNFTVHSADFQLIDDVCGHQCHRRAGMFRSVSVPIVLCDCVILPLNVFMLIVVILIDCSSKRQLYSTCVHYTVRHVLLLFLLTQKQFLSYCSRSFAIIQNIFLMVFICYFILLFLYVLPIIFNNV